MVTTPNLLITHLEANSDQPEVVVDAALDAIDAAITATVEFPVTSSNALTVTQAQFAACICMQLVHGGSPGPSATVTITVAAFERGLLVVDNQLTHDADIKISAQPGPVPRVAAGQKAILFSNGVSVSSLGTKATYQSGSLSPAAPNNTGAITMQGMAGSITPGETGNILVTISGTFTTSAALVDQGITARIYHGTGSAPGSNAGVTGTPIGATVEFTNATAPTLATDVNVPFTCTGLIIGATLGTARWLDLGCQAITTVSTFAVSNAVITAIEV